MTNYHIIKDKEKSLWKIKKENSTRTTSFAKTQKEAEKMAKKILSKQGGGEVKIHDLTGRIRDSDTVKPGNDPNPPKDKKH